jgi:uncharacterized protein YndB with AHSA1/START domain
MKKYGNTSITVSVIVKSPVARVWELWTNPFHIIHWNSASPDWHTTYAENDLKLNGKFLSRMEAKDGSFGFDFSGEYSKIDLNKCIEYTLSDERDVQVTFNSEGGKTIITETFEAELENSDELQKTGWQAILDNFRNYAEKSDRLEILHFETVINCPADIVYNSILDEEKYKKWTSVFNPTSHYSGSWKKGSKILFIGTDKDGKTGGMVSKIKENIPGKFLSIEHNGIIKDDKEITSGPDISEWAGSLENYSFIEKNKRTILSIDIDSNQEFKSYFLSTWPKALDMIKNICENKLN